MRRSFIEKSITSECHEYVTDTCVNRTRQTDQRALDDVYHPTIQPLFALGLAILTVDSALTVDAADEARRLDEMLSFLERSSRARVAMTHLTPECRKLVTLIFLQGISHARVIAKTGRTFGPLKSELRRAMMRMREAFDE